MLVPLVTFLETLELALRLQIAVPTIEPHTAYEHAAAAIATTTPRLSPDLLLAIAYVESRYDPTSVSRVERGQRRTGRYRSMRPPRALDPHTSLFCGPLQAYARSWRQCLAFREPVVGYAAAVAELERWLDDRRIRGDIARALAGHGCGNHGVTTGKCNRYPARVLRVHRKLVSLKRPAADVATPTRSYRAGKHGDS